MEQVGPVARWAGGRRPGEERASHAESAGARSGGARSGGAHDGVFFGGRKHGWRPSKGAVPARNGLQWACGVRHGSPGRR